MLFRSLLFNPARITEEEAWKAQAKNDGCPLILSLPEERAHTFFDINEEIPFSGALVEPVESTGPKDIVYLYNSNHVGIEAVAFSDDNEEYDYILRLDRAVFEGVFLKYESYFF